ncbi:uncharacterized protein LOC128264875 [Drosophila gunungcola]|uniref:uncharacterized protein LOC128264875 n=1 Tax=Drosophila gunungcola TaxID=103775 RepID=UPI0022E2CA86|nr:uncharacterized protein LOC128264875 [Drosophila gunungcola]
MQFTSNKSECRPILRLMLLMALAANACCNSSLKVVPNRGITVDDHVPWASGARLISGSPWDQAWLSWNARHTLGFGPTPSEVSNAVSVAGQASANFFVAQQQLQAAKENVLNQQRIATEKQTQAIILKQKSQAAAAIQRSEAIQQRLAASKAAVAQAAAQAAVAEIKKTEHEAVKLGYFTQIAHPSSNHHISSLKPASIHLPISNMEPIGFGSWLDTYGNNFGKLVNDW